MQCGQAHEDCAKVRSEFPLVVGFWFLVLGLGSWVLGLDSCVKEAGGPEGGNGGRGGLQSGGFRGGVGFMVLGLWYEMLEITIGYEKGTLDMGKLCATMYCVGAIGVSINVV
jgi:hypothetical protein